MARPVPGHFDVIADLAYPLPVAVICRLLGVPIEDEPQFSRASAVLARALDPIYTVTGEAHGNIDEIMDAGQWLRGYLRDLIARRRAAPGEDLMSALIHVEESGDQLTEEEIVATCNLLLIAGHETTVNLIANAILALLRHPAPMVGAVRRPAAGFRRGGGDAALRPAGTAHQPNCRRRHDNWRCRSPQG